jgi:hypothetical protein
MPGMPGQAPSAEEVMAARKGKGKKKRTPPNAQMIRNVAIVVIAVSLLLIIVTLVQSGGETTAENSPTPAVKPAGSENPAKDLPTVERGPRTDEEILTEADRLYRVASKFHEEYLVSDERLWEAYSRYQRTKALLLLVDDQGKWPSFAREIQPRVDEVDALLDAEYRRARINYVRDKDARNYEAGIREMDRLLRMFPDKNDTRHQFARTKKRQLRSMMSGKKKKGFL